MRYNYIRSATLDAGVALSMVIIIFAVQYPKGGFEINWLGNTDNSYYVLTYSRELKHGIQFGCQ